MTMATASSSVISPKPAFNGTIFIFDTYNLVPTLATMSVCVGISVCISMGFGHNRYCSVVSGGIIIIVTLLSFGLSQGFHGQQILLSTLQCIVCTRYSMHNLLVLVCLRPQETLEEKLTIKIGFIPFWIIHIMWIVLSSLPIIFVNSPPNKNLPDLFDPMNTTNIIILTSGLLMFTFGILYESIADAQKFIFFDDPRRGEYWCNLGLWYYSRHPNAFGDILLWWGFYILCSTSYANWQHFLVICTFIITVPYSMFITIPIKELIAGEKHNRYKEYQKYKAITSLLIPMSPEIYSRIPNIMKRSICLDFLSLMLSASCDTNHSNQEDIALDVVNDTTA